MIRRMDFPSIATTSIPPMSSSFLVLISIAMMFGLRYLLHLFGTIMINANRLSNPNCRCYVFNSSYNRNGQFKSPGYPRAYPPSNVDCLLYKFEGSRDEIVNIKFNSFNMLQPIENKCIDYVDLFTTIDPTNRSIETISIPADYRLCGTFKSLPQIQFYAVSHLLFLLLHTSSVDAGGLKSRKRRFGGFTGQFEFETKGMPKPGTGCDFIHDQLSLTRPGETTGNFSSPSYPSNYPPGRRCHYAFLGQPDQRVVLTFKVIKLTLGIRSSRDRSRESEESSTVNEVNLLQHDALLIYEPYNSTHRAVVGNYCDSIIDYPLQLVSNGPQLYVDFVSNNDSVQGQGFWASFEFVHKSTVESSAFDLSVTLATQMNEIETSSTPFDNRLSADATYDDVNTNHRLDDYPIDTIRSRQESSSTIMSDTRSNKSGSVLSPEFPNRYPLRHSWTLRLVGLPHERVQIDFSDLYLGDPSLCSHFSGRLGDRITIYDANAPIGYPMLTLCGSNNVTLQHSNKPITSTGRYLTIHFQTDVITREDETGFQLNYRFFTSNTSLSMQDQVHGKEQPTFVQRINPLRRSSSPLLTRPGM